MIKHSEEFKQEAVRIALTGGLSRRRVASDLGVGLSTLSKWLSQYRPSDLGSPDDRPKLPSSSISTGSKTPEDGTHIWAASARSRSKSKWHNEIGDRRKTGTSP
jgi:transposase-like protein